MSISVAIIGGGAAGSVCAYFLLKNGYNVTIFDKTDPLLTLLPTGGGKCNLAHAEFDFKALASNYPRGEKFLYSVFSKFGTSETLEMFENIGIRTYTGNDGRIFPESNSSKEVRRIILNELKKYGVKFVKKEIENLSELKDFTKIVIAIGGRSGYKLLEPYCVKIIEPKPSLVGLKTKENFSDLSGTPVKSAASCGITGDMLFTHFGISGPLVYQISSIKAFTSYPYTLNFDLCQSLTKEILQNDFDKNPHKDLKNILNKYLPHKIVKMLLSDYEQGIKAHNADRHIKEGIIERIHNFKITVIGADKGEETVTAGGIDLDEIDSKTMALKKHPNIYCIGEVLNIDGFCGGFNLQNAWSTAYICSQAVIKEN